MAENSKIEWCDHTFNPWTGCTKVSPACDHCYAEGWAKRSGHVGWGPHGSRRRTSAANWAKPLKWNKEAAASGTRPKVFCASLADVFDNHGSITSGWRGDLWHLIARTPNLDWLLLTKRPQNIKKMLPDGYGAPAWGNGWPNVWLGTTVENQDEADRRIPHLLATPAAVRFVSAEPLLGPVRLDQVINQLMVAEGQDWLNALSGYAWEHDDSGLIGSRIDWVIGGGESGPGARPMHPDWARMLRDQCQAAGVAFFFKQWGEWLPFGQSGFTSWHAHTKANGGARKTKGKWWGHAYFNDGAGGPNTHAFGPVETMMLDNYGTQTVRVGKARAGRLLDGREWNEMPRHTGDTP